MPPKRTERRRDPPYAEDGQEYARVTKMLGNGRVLAKCIDGAERLCRIRGSMRRREWVHVGDIVLLARRNELSTETADIVFKYLAHEVQRLKKMGEPVVIGGCDVDADDDDDLIAFEDEEHAAGEPLVQHHHKPRMPDSEDEVDIDGV